MANDAVQTFIDFVFAILLVVFKQINNIPIEISIMFRGKNQLICHCSAVEIEVLLPSGLEKIRRCNCSICSRKGAIVASVKLENLSVIKGKEKLTLYQFNTFTAKHYFCSICGIYTHHQRRSDPTEFGFNVACLKGVDITVFKDVPYGDGINHPKDQ